MKPITIKDIAALSGVGISTVSRVLNNRPDVSDETKQKVMDVVNLYNYTPNANAKNLKQRNADLVSIIIRGRQNSFLIDIAEHIIEYGNVGGQKFMLDFIDEAADEFVAARQHISEKKVQGLIFLGSNTVGKQDVIEDLRTPCVFATIDTGNLGLPGVSSVGVDNIQSAETAIDYLIAKGHRRIAVFGGKREIDDSIGQRYQGTMKGFQKHGLPFDPALYVQCSFLMEKAYRAARTFLQGRPSFTAIFAMSDMMAIGIIKALYDEGLRVPEDVSVIGFDGISLSRFTLPTLTTIVQPAQDIAHTSVRLIRRLMEDPRGSQNVLLPIRLQEGGSVRPL